MKPYYKINFRDKASIVHFANGLHVYPQNAEMVPCVTTEDAWHGDWKTSLVHGPKMIPKGEQCHLVCMWSNYYGDWATVRFQGSDYDVKPSQLIYDTYLDKQDISAFNNLRAKEIEAKKKRAK